MRDYEQTMRELRDPQYVYHYSRDYLKNMMDDAADAIEELKQNIEKYKLYLQDAINDLRHAHEKEPKWISVTEQLPEEDGKYIVHIRDIEEGREICGVSCVDASYITTAFFDKSQMIWKEYDDIDCSCYNAALSAIGTKHRAYISHWMLMPEYPGEV